jgi:hypothetical protein
MCDRQYPQENCTQYRARNSVAGCRGNREAEICMERSFAASLFTNTFLTGTYQGI